MPPLPQPLRRQLENAIKQARVDAEGGARDAVQALAVHHHEPHPSMTPEQRKLRNRLRAHGRQLGDARNAQGGQEVRRLLREVAYEHWHRMLFARFLAENDLLIEPSNRVSVSLSDVEDLARLRGVDPWSMAASFAQRMLPQIFRQDDPVLQVALPPETRQKLEALVVGLPSAVFTAEDALGWTYQFWQSAEKVAVNARVKSGEKISGETLPAVTQLFTEHYMVQFLLHNTLGAWHAGKVLAAQPDLAKGAKDEAELRAAVALSGYEFDYLRFVREVGDGPWRPAAGVFAAWPKSARELRVLDPCCGSGHFLVASFELLAALREQEEGLSFSDAVTAVLRDNLFGLELDARCTQIAAFALAMAAWKRVGSLVELPTLQVACCGIGPSGTKEQWLKLAEQAAAEGGMPVKRDLFRKEESLLSSPIRSALEDLYLLFQKAPELGALIDPKATAGSLYQADYKTVQPLLARVMQAEAVGEDAQEQAVAAQGMAKAAAILGQTFTLVVTNVPYLGRGAQGEVMKEFAEQHYPDAKADLATVFVQRAFEWLGKSGTMAVVTPQNWLFLKRYRKLREDLLEDRTWNLVARLGPKGFQTPMWDYNIMLLVLSACGSQAHVMSGVDVAAARKPVEKAALLRGEAVSAGPDGDADADFQADDEETGAEDENDARASGPADGTVKLVSQADQLKNPDARIVFTDVVAKQLLTLRADSYQGIGTSDNAQFVFMWWEPERVSADYRYVQVAPRETAPISGCTSVLHWEEGSGRYYRHAMGLKAEGRLGGWKSGGEAWNRPGIAVSVTGRPLAAAYLGTMFDTTMAAVVPKIPEDLAAVLACVSAPDFEKRAREMDQALSLTEHSLLKVPFDLAHWQRIAAEQYPHGVPEPQTNDPTQWLFHGQPAGMVAAGPASSSPLAIQDSVGHERHPSLVCRTPNTGDVLQVATARLLGYRWPAELDPAMRLDVAQRDWASRCDDLLGFADTDGIVCLSPIRSEPSAADRLRKLLRAAFGAHWRPDTERTLLDAAAQDGKRATDLDAWLRDEFFAAHTKLFHDRPFVWHLWDGIKDGFHALVNYHKLASPNGGGRRTLELLTFTYLNDWIERQRADMKADREGADGRLVAALRLQDELKKILTGEPPYDLFIRWKPLHQQPLGWDPDINDGVRLNIRPFILAADMKQKGAGLLRSKVGVKWTKDRGKEPEPLRPRDQFPWFWSCDPENPQHQTDYVTPKTAAFDGVRWNELHYTRAAKEAARNGRSKVSP